MAGTQATVALNIAGAATPEVHYVKAGATVRLITAASSTAKVEVSYDDGATFTPWAFGTQAASLTKNEVLLRDAVVKATIVTGTATFEIDAPATGEAHSRFLVGTGTPLNLVAAHPGTLFLAIGGGAATTLYVKTSGAGTTAGWQVLTAA